MPPLIRTVTVSALSITISSSILSLSSSGHHIISSKQLPRLLLHTRRRHSNNRMDSQQLPNRKRKSSSPQRKEDTSRRAISNPSLSLFQPTSKNATPTSSTSSFALPTQSSLSSMNSNSESIVSIDPSNVTTIQDLPSSSTTSTTQQNVGFNHWVSQRRTWTQGHKPHDPVPNPNAYKRNPYLREVEHKHFASVYASLVSNSRRLAKPLPLDFLVQVMVQGWEEENIRWPAPGDEEGDDF